MDERIRIQSHLEQLREECIREYLEGKLETIASKEVVNDILVGLLKASNREFLENITENILEVRSSNKKLKETIDKMKAEKQEYARSEAMRAREEIKQLHLIEISQLREQLGLIKLNLQAENQQSIRRVMALTEQLNAACRDNEELKNLIVDKNQVISKLEKEMQECRQTQAIKNQAMAAMERKQKEQENQYNSSIQTIINDKQKKILELAQRHHEQLKQSASEKEKLVQQHARQILKFEASIQETMQLMQQKEEDLTASRNQSNLLRQQIIKKQQQISTISHLLARNEQKVFTTMQQLQAAVNQHQQKLIESHSLVNHLRQAKLKVEEKVALLDNEVKQLKAEISGMQTKENSLQEVITQKEKQHIYCTMSHKAEMQALKEEMLNKDRKIEKMQSKIDQECEVYLNCQEEIKNLLKYNVIHQEETAKYEADIAQIKQECKAEIITYQQTYSLTVDSLEQELRQANEKIAAKKGEIDRLKEELQGQREKDKYYALYLEEIALLKQQLYKHTSNSLANKHIYLIGELRDKVHILAAQNNKLKTCIQAQLSQMRENWQESVRYLISQAQLHVAKCLYCQHEKKMPVIFKHQGSMDRTVAKGRQVHSMSSIKRNLQSIQEKYLQVNQQNKSFANRVESLLHN